MKLRYSFVLFIGILLSSFITPKAFAQHTVLFETFGDATDFCPAPIEFYTQINTTVSDETSRMIHLDYHIASDFSDPIENFNSAFLDMVASRLDPASGGKENVFFGAVDRTILPISGAQTETEQNNGGWGGDMESQINSQNSISPPATLQLVSATMDKSRPLNYIFNATVAVTAPSGSGGDSIIIHYAVVEDNVSIPSKDVCSGTQTEFSDVVRWITTGDSIVFLPSTPSGTVNVSFQQADFTGNSQQANLKNMRFIAFIMSGGQVVNAADLKDDLSSLPAPPPSLTLDNSATDDSVFSPGAPGIGVPFVAINVPLVNAYYSFDKGNSWVTITDSIPITQWPTTYLGVEFPDTSITNTGKIKIVDAVDTTVFAIEDGTFSIKVQPTITIIHPDYLTDTLAGGSTFPIQWSEVGVTSVKLEYALDPFQDYQLIADNVTGTTYNWTVPDTAKYADLRITDDNNEAAAAISLQPFQIKKTIANHGVVEGTNAQSGLTITSIAPNPAENGEQLIVRYSDANAPSIRMEMLDLLGHTVVTRTLTASSNGEADIQTQTLGAGAYIVRMNDGTNTVTKRVEIIR